MDKKKVIELGFKYCTELNSDEYFSVWRICYNGEILHLGLRAEEIEENSDFPTRDKARQGKKDIKHSEWLSNAKKQFAAITSEQMFGRYPNGLSIGDRIFIFIDDGPLEISVENWRVNSPKKEGYFNHEAARLAWLKDRRKNQFAHISKCQAQELKIDDKYYLVFNNNIIEYTYGRNFPGEMVCDYLENCYFSEKAAAIALKKQDKDLAELAKIGQEIQPEYYTCPPSKLGEKYLIKGDIYTITFVGPLESNGYRLVGKCGVCWSTFIVNMKQISEELTKQKATKIDTKISRVEFISEKGRDFIAWNHGVENGKHFELSYQDGGRTLKIFERKLS